MPKIKNIADEFGITNIINYLRRSRKDEERERKTGEDTLTEQKNLMDRVLSEYGIPYEQRSEIGSGDKISSRPVFQTVIKDLENGKFDAIAIKEISRMGRGSYTDMGIIYDLLVDKCIYIITPWKIYDPSNNSDLRQIRFELFMSREEYETTRERLNGGRYNAAMEGKWVAGPAPYGYNYNKTTGHLEVNEAEANLIRKVFDFYGYGVFIDGKRKLVQFTALSNYLRRIGVRTITGKRHWHQNVLKYMLTNETYIGTTSFNGIKVENAHPPIIDKETWEVVQNRIKNRNTNTNTRMDFSPSELAGLCICKECGVKMVRQYSVSRYKKLDGTVSEYHKEFIWCKTNRCASVKYRSVEEDLLLVLKHLRDLDSEKLRRELNLIVKEKRKEDTTAEELKKQIENKKEELKRRMDFIFEKYESGIYTDDIFLARKKEVDLELEELNKMNIDNDREEEKEIDTSVVKENITTILDAYQKANHKSKKNEILHAVFDSVIVEVIEKGRGRKSAKYALYPTLKYDILSPSLYK
ncbi:MAG TPA: recombinase family protein [Massilibacterium sp.]|nr:recombinase family protein [Massilibacterium sp.]